MEVDWSYTKNPSMEAEIKNMGHTWKDITQMAQNTTQWRTFVDGLCSQRINGSE